ncbi:MAG: hypothetical protein N4A49_01920 [Marinifilaceae bacterium]|jgi:hypothetical protein|nr:hypothetical protein [Marinifilaceae bacterium]
MTQKELDKLIRRMMPKIQKLLKIDKESYLTIRFEVGMRWLESMDQINKTQAFLISKSKTFWDWFHSMYYGKDRTIISQKKQDYTTLPVGLRRETYILEQLHSLPVKIPHTPMYYILEDIRDWAQIKRIMNTVRQKLTSIEGTDLESIKRYARDRFQEFNPHYRLTTKAWEEIWCDIEKQTKEFNDNYNPEDDDLILFFSSLLESINPNQKTQNEKTKNSQNQDCSADS